MKQRLTVQQSKYRVQAYICGLPQGRAIYEQLDTLTVQVYKGRSYLYRPSVDLLIREVLCTSGLSDLELSLTLSHRQNVKICSRKSEAESKKQVFYDFMTKTAEHFWEYLAIVCVPDEQLVHEETMKAFNHLAEQLNMKDQKGLLNHMMQTWYAFHLIHPSSSTSLTHPPGLSTAPPSTRP